MPTATSTLEGFKYWMLERHAIYTKRKAGSPPPWTSDQILQEWKFTNVFRELDRGTVALHTMLAGKHGPNWRQSTDLAGIAFNVCWYRLFNLDHHAHNCGFCDHAGDVSLYIHRCHRAGSQIFTAAHMLTGSGGGPKHELYLRTVEMLDESREEIVKCCHQHQTLETLCSYLRMFPMIGPFLAYEMACDLRWVEGLWGGAIYASSPSDVLTWANPGPGAKRGLARLGRPETIEAMVTLFCDVIEDEACEPLTEFIKAGAEFELREIEHSLCEFDKYERVRLGEGQPRQRFRQK